MSGLVSHGCRLSNDICYQLWDAAHELRRATREGMASVGTLEYKYNDIFWNLKFSTAAAPALTFTFLTLSLSEL